VPDVRRHGDRFGERAKRRGVLQRSVRSMPVVAGFELAERMEKVALAPDQGAVQQLASARLYPALHEAVHAQYLDAGRDDLQPGVGRQGVEGVGELGVSVTDQEPGPAARVLQVHDQVASELHDPLRRRVCGGAQDPDAGWSVQ